jgi:hypothetical protein
MPSSKNYVRDYKQEAAIESEARKKARTSRHKARRMLEAKGLVHKGDGKDVGHVRAIGKGGTTTLSNLKVQAPTANRSFSRHADGSMISETSKKERKKSGK